MSKTPNSSQINTESHYISNTSNSYTAPLVKLILTDYLTPRIISNIPTSLHISLLKTIEDTINIGFLKGKTLISEAPSILINDSSNMKLQIEEVIQVKLYQWIQEYNGKTESKKATADLFDRLSNSGVTKIAKDAASAILKELTTTYS